jgi:DNA-binding transcriptional ArsR family regulator
VKRQRYLKPRRLVADDEFFRRRAQGATLRELADAYGVAHTTLSRHLRRPDAQARLRDARLALREEEREHRDEVRRAAKERRKKPSIDRVAIRESSMTPVERGSLVVELGQVDADPPQVEPRRHVHPSDYANWLDERDNALPLTRRDSWTTNDQIAAKVVSEGGGIEKVMEATGHRDLLNLRRLIDPELLAAADRNDARAGDS